MKAATDWKETIAPGEDAQLLEFAERLRAIQRKAAAGGSVSAYRLSTQERGASPEPDGTDRFEP